MDKSGDITQNDKLLARLKRRDLLKAAYAAPILAPLILNQANAAGQTACTPNSCSPVTCSPVPEPCAPVTPCAPNSCAPTNCAPWR